MLKLFLSGLIGAAVIGAGAFSAPAHACIAKVSEAKLFRVNIPNAQIIRAETDDMIRIVLLNPGSGSKPGIRFDSRVLKLTAESSYLKDTGMTADEGGQVYYLSVIGAGSTTIKAGYDGRDQVIQEVEATDPPRTRGMCR